MSDEPVLRAIAELRGELRQEIAEFRGELRQGTAELRNELRQAIAELRSELRQEITELRVALMERMDRFENRLTQLRDDVGVTLGRVDRAQEAADNARTELRLLGEEVAGIHRQLRRLQAQVDGLTGS